MKKRQVVVNGDIPFRQMDWGLTKDLVGPERMGSEKIRFKITEYQPGYSHKLVHPVLACFLIWKGMYLQDDLSRASTYQRP